MPAPNPVRLGLIGLGRIALSQHLPALRRVPGLRVVALCDTDPQHLARAAALCPGAASYADYRALLAQRDLEAVGILTPPQSHAEIALAALDAGLHTLIEKPLAMSLDESEALLTRADGAGAPCVVVVGFNTRWHRLVRRARQMIQAGAVGQVQAIRSAYAHYMSVRGISQWAKRRATGGGLLMSEAPHHLDLWRYLLQREIEQVYALSHPASTYDDHRVTLSARLEGDVLATGVILAETSPTNELEVYGDQGRLCVSLYRVDGLQCYAKQTYPGDLRTRLRQAAGLLREMPEIVGALRSGGDFDASYAALWQHLFDAIRHAAPVGCTLEDGHRALQAALAAAESAHLGQPVRVAQAPRRAPAIETGRD